MQAKAGVFAKTTSAATVTQAITGVGFQPNIVVFYTVGATSLDAWLPGIRMCLGFAVDEGGTIKERAISAGVEDNAATSSSSRAIVNTKCIFTHGGTASLLAAADMQSFDSDGFTLSWTSNDAVARQIGYLALQVPSVAVRNFNTSATGSGTITGLGFDPTAVMMLATNVASYQTTVSTVDVFWAFGAAAGSGQWATALMDDQGQATTNNNNLTRTDRIFSMPNSFAGAASSSNQIEFTSFDTGGITYNVTNHNAARAVEVILIGGVVAQAETFGKATAAAPTTNVRTGYGFQPKAALVTSTAHTTGTNSADHMRQTIGFSDGTNSVSGTLYNTDALADSNANSFVTTQKAIGISASNTDAIAAAADLSFQSDGMTFTWTRNDANAWEVSVLAFGDSETPKTGTDTADVGSTGSGSISATIGSTDASAASVSESASQAATLGAAGTSSVGVSESGSSGATNTATDSVSLSTPELSSVSVTVSGTDASSITSSESGATTVPTSGSDASAVSVSESGSPSLGTSGADGPATTVSESASVVPAMVAAENNPITVTESAAPVATDATTDAANVSPTETGGLAAAVAWRHGFSLGESELGGDDPLGDDGPEVLVLVVESSDLDTSLVGIDAVDVAVSESGEQGVITPVCFELGLSTLGGYDTLCPPDEDRPTDETAVVDSDEIAGVVAADATADTAGIVATEFASPDVSVSSSDTVSVVATESGVASLAFGAADSVSVSLSESGTPQVLESHADSSDANAVSVSDSASISVVQVSTDGSSVSVSELGSPAASQSATDTSSTSSTETASNTAAISANNPVAVPVFEEAELLVGSAGIDATGIASVESFAIQSAVQAAMVSALSASESATVVVQLGAGDSASITDIYLAAYVVLLTAGDAVSLVSALSTQTGAALALAMLESVSAQESPSIIESEVVFPGPVHFFDSPSDADTFVADAFEPEYDSIEDPVAFDAGEVP